jgi:hypothetical protein
VGSYLLARFDLTQIPDACTIYAFHLTVVQTQQIVPIDEFMADNLTTSGTEFNDNVVIHTEGVVPKQTRPDSHAPAIWKGSAVEGETEGDSACHGRFRWETGKIRMPHEKLIRPSTSEG